MLIALRAILLVLFIAAPFGEHRTAAELPAVADDFAIDAILTCPLTGGVPRNIRTAGEPAIARPDAPGGNA